MKRDLRKMGIDFAVRASVVSVPLGSLGLYALIYALFYQNAPMAPREVLLITANVGICWGFLVSQWVHVARGGPLRGILEFCNQASDPEAMLAHLEKIWDEGLVTEERKFRADPEYLIGITSLFFRFYARVIPIKDVIWVRRFDYEVRSARGLEVYTSDGKKTLIMGREPDRQEIMDYMQEHSPGIIMGDDETLRKLLGVKRKEDRDLEGALAYIRELKAHGNEGKAE